MPYWKLQSHYASSGLTLSTVKNFDPMVDLVILTFVLRTSIISPLFSL